MFHEKQHNDAKSKFSILEAIDLDSEDWDPLDLEMRLWQKIIMEDMLFEDRPFADAPFDA